MSSRMNEKDKQSRSSSSNLQNSGYTPIYSREMSMQAHFTFGNQISSIPRFGAPPLGSNTQRPLADNHQNHTCWREEDGSRYALSCHPQGMTVRYNTPSYILPESNHHHYSRSNTAPLPIEAAVEPSRNDTHNTEVRLAKPSRSSTFNCAESKEKVPQKPYGRRCKSTAHIVLKPNRKENQKAHEFHDTFQREFPRIKPKSDAPPLTRAEGGKYHRMKGAPLPKMNKIPEEGCHHDCCGCSYSESNYCGCHHCSVWRIMSTVSCTCTACLNEFRHRRNHCKQSSKNCNREYDDRPRPYNQDRRRRSHDQNTKHKESNHQPSTSFNSHRCYEDDDYDARVRSFVVHILN